MGLYVPLVVNYAEDEKIIDVGPMGELLFIRSLAFAKRQDKRDGRIADNQLPLFSSRIPRARAIADRLYETGLWRRNGSGLYITAWLNHNKATEELAAAKSAAGALGNHRRWHVGPNGSPNGDCKHCVEGGLA